MTHTGAQIKRKNIGRFVSKLPNVWFQSLRCFFQIFRCFSDSPKGQKDKRIYMIVFIHLTIRTMRYIADLYYIKCFYRRVTLRILKSCFAPTWIVLFVMKWLGNSWTKLPILSGLFSERAVLGKKSDILFAFASAFNDTIIRQYGDIIVQIRGK